MVVAGKVVTSSTIPLTTTVLPIFQIKGNGGVVEDIVVSSIDSTGLAGGTNVFIIVGNGTTTASVTAFSTAVSGLGSFSSKSIATASVTGGEVAFPAGITTVAISSTVGACTGAGQVLVTIKVRGLDDSITVQAL